MLSEVQNAIQKVTSGGSALSPAQLGGRRRKSRGKKAGRKSRKSRRKSRKSRKSRRRK